MISQARVERFLRNRGARRIARGIAGRARGCTPKGRDQTSAWQELERTPDHLAQRISLVLGRPGAG